MDGNYQRTLEMRINACDTIILLDFENTFYVPEDKKNITKNEYIPCPNTL